MVISKIEQVNFVKIRRTGFITWLAWMHEAFIRNIEVLTQEVRTLPSDWAEFNTNSNDLVNVVTKTKIQQRKFWLSILLFKK